MIPPSYLKEVVFLCLIIKKGGLMKENKYYIYCHYDRNDIPRYIGKGIHKENGTHPRCRSKEGRNEDWWKLYPNGIPNKVEIIEKDIPRDKVDGRENYWIVYYGMIKDGGILINRQLNTAFMTDKERNKLRWEREKNKIKKINKKWRDNHKEELTKKKKEYYLKNREKVLNKCKDNYQKSKENYRRKYREKYREKHPQIEKRKQTREERLKYSRQYYLKNREILLEKSKISSKIRYSLKKKKVLIQKPDKLTTYT